MPSGWVDADVVRYTEPRAPRSQLLGRDARVFFPVASDDRHRNVDLGDIFDRSVERGDRTENVGVVNCLDQREMAAHAESGDAEFPIERFDLKVQRGSAAIAIVLFAVEFC